MSDTRPAFDYFAIVAGMRTGSNLLEERLNEHPGLTSLGELFNPHFVGGPKRQEALGITRAERNTDPIRMISAVANMPDVLAGFRLFDGHDGRVLDHIVKDPRCAKILLTRNPLDSFVSLKIARETKQWWLGNVASKKSARVAFDGDEFRAFLDDHDAFQAMIHRSLQTAGQTAFRLGYNDLADTDVLDGLVRYLGLEPVLWKARPKAKVQNPGPVQDKLTNPQALAPALTGMDRFDPDHIPDFEPARGAGARGILVAEKAGLAYLPVGSFAVKTVEDWLVAANGGAALTSGMTQRELKAWFRNTPNHRAFAVIAHPVDRAFAVYSARVLGQDSPLTAILHKDFDLPDGLSPTSDIADLRAGFASFLAYVKATLSGQTGHRIDADWASQTAILEGVAPLRVPDMVIRADALAEGLATVAASAKIVAPDAPPISPDPRLEVICDDRIEATCRAAYRRDYAFLGFSDWREKA